MAEKIELRGLVNNPTESLAVEIKTWFDPSSPEGIAKIVKCAIAMRNHGGGHMVIGLDNKSGQSVDAGYPADVRDAFHIDVVQPLITKYASAPFEVTLDFIERDGRVHPVIGIPGGAQTPVAVRAGLKSANGKGLLQENRVYVRSLDANGSPSSTEALWKDWEKIVNTCFDNRETDIVRFVRRHLSGVSPEVLRIAASLLEASASGRNLNSGSILGNPSRSAEPKGTGNEQAMIPSADEDHEQLKKELDLGHSRFLQIQKERGTKLPEHGAWEAIAIVHGSLAQMRPTREFLARILANNPNYTGWPIWFDSRNFSENSYRPYVFEEAWESYVPDFADSMFPNIDFWRIFPSGKFYHYRALVDDIPGEKRPQKPLTELDFAIPMWRVTEAIAVALEYSKAYGATQDANTLAMGFRWSKLRGRVLTTWSDRKYTLSSDRHAYQDEVGSSIRLPIDTPPSRIPEFVRNATAPLYEIFEGFEVPMQTIEDVTRRVLERKW